MFKAVSTDAPQAEFDAIKDHLNAYMSKSMPAPIIRSAKKPTRHISHVAQMTAKALRRDTPGLVPPKVKDIAEKQSNESDDLTDYPVKESWRRFGVEKGMEDVELMEKLSSSGLDGVADLTKRWSRSWAGETMARSVM